MVTTNFVPISAALGDLYSIIDEAVENSTDILAWAWEAVQKLHIRVTYSEKIKIVEVHNHKACAPADCIYIDLVTYQDSLNHSSLPMIELVAGDNITNTPKWLTFDDSCEFFVQNWKPLRLATSPFSKSVHCENSINIYASCTDEYSVGPSGDITTSFKDGWLCIAYLGWPMDEDTGEYLIPEDIEVFNAIQSWCMMRINERRWNYGVENAERLYTHYLSQAEMRLAKARGKLQAFSLDQWQNFQDQMVRIGSHYESYHTGFGNLRTPEKTIFTHVFPWRRR